MGHLVVKSNRILSIIIVLLLFSFVTFSQNMDKTSFDLISITDSTELNVKIDGKKVGWWVTTNIIGNVKTISYYEDGKKNGLFYKFYFNGRCKLTGYYIDNERDGVFDVWSRKHEHIKYGIKYQDGKRINKVEYWYQ